MGKVHGIKKRTSPGALLMKAFENGLGGQSQQLDRIEEAQICCAAVATKFQALTY